MRAIPDWPQDPVADAVILAKARARADEMGAKELALVVPARELDARYVDTPLQKGERPRARFMRYVETAATRLLHPPTYQARGNGAPARSPPSRRIPHASELDRGRFMTDAEHERAIEAAYAATHDAHTTRDPTRSGL